MHNFKIPLNFDVIFCVYDGINFLTNFKKWESTFKSVRDHLNDGGLFVFDMYTPKTLKDFKNNSPTITKVSFGYTYDKPIIKGNNLTWDYKVFEKIRRNHYELQEYKWTEKIYSIPKVRKSIVKYFKILESKFMNKKKNSFCL